MSEKAAVTKASLLPTREPAAEPARGEVQRSARERLLAAANELFYAEGVHSVGIDRVIERAGVAKASLYNTFGSKDELIRTYLQSRHEVRRGRIEAKIAEFDQPRDQILAVFDLLGEIFQETTFRGCAFLNASAEPREPGSRVTETCDDARAFVRNLFADLARRGGLANPDRLGRQLVLLYDGAGVGAQMDRDPSVAAAARAAAAALIDAATPQV
jgi:AcrR family transcriptional regulator